MKKCFFFGFINLFVKVFGSFDVHYILYNHNHALHWMISGLVF